MRCTAPGCEYETTPGVRSSYLINGLCPRHRSIARRKGQHDTAEVCGFTGCERTDGLRHRRCPEHQGVYDPGPALRWKERNKERADYSDWARRNNLWRNYRITPEQYDEQLITQDERCAICGATESQDRWQTLAVDHDHETGALRGLLCGHCNKALGLFGDDITRLEAAIHYLRAGGTWAAAPERLAA